VLKAVLMRKFWLRYWDLGFWCRIDGCTMGGLMGFGVTFRVKSRLKASIEEFGVWGRAGALGIGVEFI
jgi:hypothetical protein